MCQRMNGPEVFPKSGHPLSEPLLKQVENRLARQQVIDGSCGEGTAPLQSFRNHLLESGSFFLWVHLIVVTNDDYFISPQQHMDDLAIGL